MALAQPLPDVVLYGSVTVNGQTVSADDDVTLIARVDGAAEPVGSYHMGYIAEAGDHYALRVRLESTVAGEPQSDNAAQIGQTVDVYLERPSEPDILVQSVVIERAATVQNVDISAECHSHPADVSADYEIVIGEATAYASCWKTGCTWANPPNPIPISFMTRTAFLWKTGERYCCDSTATEPLSWINCPTTTASAAGSRAPHATLAIPGSATREFSTGRYVPQQELVVTIAVTPHPDAVVYAVDDAIPAGWIVTETGDAGVFDSGTGTVRWGPFFDTFARSLSYRLTPPSDASGLQSFSGTLSADGVDSPIGGSGQIEAYGRVDLADFAKFQACFSGSDTGAGPQCGLFDWDNDGNVDLADFVGFEAAFAGPR